MHFQSISKGSPKPRHCDKEMPLLRHWTVAALGGFQVLGNDSQSGLKFEASELCWALPHCWLYISQYGSRIVGYVWLCHIPIVVG